MPRRGHAAHFAVRGRGRSPASRSPHADRQLLSLRHVREREPLISVFVLPPFEGVVVFMSTRANPLPHGLRLIGRRLGTVLVGALDEHLPLSNHGETGVANGSRASKRSLVLGGGQTHTPPTKAGDTGLPHYLA